ncbi:MAG: HAMP domain-containing protein [Spirulinaceae cyanobacterium SM2_1_0]|nr:HAMP domain-containing protein [Spirulinaceae cyanobacterium SM2_1_0]
MKFWSKSLRVRLVTYFSLLSLLTVGTVGLLTFLGARVVITRLVFDRLRVTALLKEAALQRWLEDQQADVAAIAQLPPLNTHFATLAQQPARRDSPNVAYTDIRRALQPILASNPNIAELKLLRASDGQVLFASHAHHEGKSYQYKHYFQAGLAAPSITPVERNRAVVGSQSTLAISQPLTNADNTVIGVLVVEVHPEGLSQIVNEPDGLGLSGKSYLVNRRRQLVAGMHFEGDESPIIDSPGIAKTLAGSEGGALYADYGGQPVIGYTRWLEPLELVLLVEIDQREAFLPARHLASGIFLVGATSVVLLTGAVYLLAKQITRPILAIKAAAIKVAAGDFQQTAPVLTEDEVGVLAKAFNRMTERLRDLYVVTEQKLVQLELAEISLHRSLKDLEIEQAKSERLLLNTLPSAIAQRLRQGESVIAEQFEAVSVLFADIVAFTRLSARLSPPALVQVLNAIFSEFDQLSEAYGLEKIKTIGDAYMVVGGLPEPRADHAQAIAAMAIAMQTAIQRFNRETGENFSIRIGIHSGAVIAGVIGIRKFSYDLWGDTVNVASRMESQGLPGKIQVTDVTYALLCDRFEFEPRGAIQVRGRGEMQTYFLVGRKPMTSCPDDRPSESSLGRRLPESSETGDRHSA